jgi:hypothetical protein
MDLSAQHNLYGPGYSAVECLLKSAKVFSMGGIPEFLSKNPNFSPTLLHVIRRVKYDLRVAIAEGQTNSEWGGSYYNDYLDVLRYFRLA